MGATSAGAWIPSEKTPPIILPMFGGGIGILLAMLLVGYEALDLAGSPVELVAVLAAVVAINAVTDLYFWNVWAPTAVRITPEGLEVRRRFGRPAVMAADSLQLRAGDPAGFAYAFARSAAGCYLTPRQHEAVRTAFPTAAKGATAA